jgi:hypothetical protein
VKTRAHAVIASSSNDFTRRGRRAPRTRVASATTSIATPESATRDAPIPHWVTWRAGSFYTPIDRRATNCRTLSHLALALRRTGARGAARPPKPCHMSRRGGVVRVSLRERAGRQGVAVQGGRCPRPRAFAAPKERGPAPRHGCGRARVHDARSPSSTAPPRRVVS